MSNILTFFGAIVFALALILLMAFIFLSMQFLLFFKWRKCNHCHHTMEYKGMKEDDNNGHYLFHCPKCGAWEQVPKEDFFRQCDNPIDEN